MDEDYNMVCGIDKLAELLIERGIEFCVNDEFSLVFKDNVGNLHECWMAGVDENRVNALIVVTPEQLLSVPDLNSIIAENAKLRELARYHVGAVEDCGCCHCPYYEDADCPPETEPMREGCRLRSELRGLGVEVDG